MTFSDYTKRILTIISGGGLSINGKHIYCGDYIFSGHTMTLTMGYLVIKQCKISHYAFPFYQFVFFLKIHLVGSFSFIGPPS